MNVYDSNIPTAPILNTNGSSAAQLLEEYQWALLAVREAMDAISGCAPVLMDYPGNGVSFETAHREHFARKQRLAFVRDELAYIVDTIKANRSMLAPSGVALDRAENVR